LTEAHHHQDRQARTETLFYRGADKGRYVDIGSQGIEEHPAADCGMIAV
jgi:hypothetical protein